MYYGAVPVTAVEMSGSVKTGDEKTDKYVVWSPSMGGWNKYHIAKANETTNSSAVYLFPLCGNNRGATVNAWWLELRGMIPFTEASPLEGKAHQCDRCIVKWWHLRDKEGYPTEGVFAV